MMKTTQQCADDIVLSLEREAQCIYNEDAQINRRIGEKLLTLLPQHGTILTYCNAGALATTDPIRNSAGAGVCWAGGRPAIFCLCVRDTAAAARGTVDGV